MLANPQCAYRRSLRFRWPGKYFWVLSEIAFHEKASRTKLGPHKRVQRQQVCLQ
jgi:hypothetical protein